MHSCYAIVLVVSYVFVVIKASSFFVILVINHIIKLLWLMYFT